LTTITTEHQEQCAVCHYLNLNKYLYCAIPNSNALSALNRNIAMRVMSKLKKEGLKKGVSDLVIFEARKGFHALAIEMKRKKGSTVSLEQKEWRDELLKRNYKAVICKGADEAIKQVQEYMQ